MPYQVLDIASGRVIAEGASLGESEVTREKGGFSLGRLFVPGERVQIVPSIDGTIVVNGKAYRGKMAFVPGGAWAFAIVNYVNLEHYVASVVSGEMYSYWPEAALRAQAVAARTYALWRMNQKDKKGEWDLTAGQEAQVYSGLSGETATSRKAAQDSFGVVLTYEGKIFAAYYHSTCGDSTASVLDVFGEEEIPPLSGVPCRNCQESPFYRWTVNVSQEELVERLKSAGFAVEQISDVKVIESDASGRAKSIEIETPKSKFLIKPNEFRRIFGGSRIRSTAFSIALEGGVFVIRGAGWGHGVGMCQWGARGMAKMGFTAEEILHHFYPESDLIRLY
jgi:stage II sporulation protein D